MRRVTLYCEDEMLTDIAVADSYFLRLRGLIGRDPKQLGGLLLKPCNQIHTCFMSEPIDVLYLDRDNRVLSMEDTVPAGRFCRRVRGAVSVLELPAGFARARGVHPGSALRFLG